MSKIDITKKYKTRDGRPVELISDKGRGEYVFIGYIGDDNSPSTWQENGSFWGGESDFNLVEVEPESVYEYLICLIGSGGKTAISELYYTPQEAKSKNGFIELAEWSKRKRS